MALESLCILQSCLLMPFKVVINTEIRGLDAIIFDTVYASLTLYSLLVECYYHKKFIHKALNCGYYNVKFLIACQIAISPPALGDSVCGFSFPYNKSD